MKNRILAILMTLVMVLSIIPVGLTASAESNFFEYEALSDDEVIILSYYGKDTDVIIPSAIDGRTVAAIGMEAFAYNEIITTITIPSSVWLIEPNAFVGCTNLAIVYYEGTEEERAAIEIGEGNESLTDAIWYTGAGDSDAGSDAEVHTHSYDSSTIIRAATCTENGIISYTCKECGETVTEELPAIGHDYESTSSDDGTTTRVCSRCGEVSSGEVHTHSYEKGTITMSPTCTEDGEIVYYCDCGMAISESISATGHNYEYTTVDGKEVYACTNCGEIGESDGDAEVHQHVIGEDAKIREATCTADGYRMYTCPDCGEFINEVIPAFGHNYEVIKNEDGTVTRVCTYCGDGSESGGDAHEHSYEESGREEATCMREGIIMYTCSGCGDSYTETIPALEHNYEVEYTASGTEIYTCTVCGDSYEISGGDEHQHVIGDDAKIREATCTADGYRMYTCPDCGEFINEVIPAFGHNYEVIKNEDGTVTRVCTYCGDGSESGGDAHEHSYEESGREEATCMREGIIMYTCSGCGDSYTETIPALEHNYEYFAEKGSYACTNCGDIKNDDVEVPHSHSYKVSKTVEPTCLEDGITYLVCDCGEMKTEVTPALGHNYDYITVDGMKVYACTNCGEIGESGGEAECEHEYRVEERAATCTEWGGRYYNCEKCGSGYEEGIPPIGHNFENGKCTYCGESNGEEEHTHSRENGKVIKAATCTEEGEIVYYCDCGMSFAESIPAIGHNFENGKCTHCGESNGEEVHTHSYEKVTIIRAATCTAAGIKQLSCSCGESKTETIPAFGHNEITIPGREPTEDEEGLTEGVECGNCGEILVEQEIIPALGGSEPEPDPGEGEECEHNYDDGEISIEATCTEDGVMVYTCLDCGEAVTEEIPALGHSFDEGEYVDGVLTYICSVCGETETEENVPDAPQIVVDSKTTTAGKQVEVSVSITNNPGFSWLSITPEYSPELELLKVKNGTVVSDLTSGLNLTWAPDNDALGDGVLVTLVFQVADSVEAGDYDVDLIFNECYNSNEEDVYFEMVGGIVTVLDYEYGDANGDGEIDGKDVVRLKNYLANYNYSTGTSTVEIFGGADANGDETVDGKDVIRLKKYLANYDYDTGSSSVVLGPQN